MLVYRGNTTEHVVALTFDAGSDRGYTPEILDVLVRDGIHATFGLTGVWVETYPDLARRIVRDRNQVVDHSYDHRSFTGYSTNTAPLTIDERTQEIERGNRAIETVTGRSTKPFFRPPYGDIDLGLRVLADRLGHHDILMWTVDTLGWKGVPASEIIGRVLASLGPGDIILMHVGAQSTDARALPRLIADLRARGYRFVTAAELVGR